MTADEIAVLESKLSRAMWILRAVAALKPGPSSGGSTTLTVPNSLLAAMDLICNQILPERQSEKKP